MKSDVQNTNEAIDSKDPTHSTGVSDEIDQTDQMRMAIITPDPTPDSLVAPGTGSADRSRNVDSRDLLPSDFAGIWRITGGQQDRGAPL